jgi:ribosomal protein S20
MRFTKLAAATAIIALGSTLAGAADKPPDKKEKAAAPAAATAKPTDKGAQGGIILQNQGNKAADKGAQGGIILQNQGAKAPAGASKTATQKTTGATQ